MSDDLWRSGGGGRHPTTRGICQRCGLRRVAVQLRLYPQWIGPRGDGPSFEGVGRTKRFCEPCAADVFAPAITAFLEAERARPTLREVQRHKHENGDEGKQADAESESRGTA